MDIRKACPPNVPWPFPSKWLKNVPGPEPMDEHEASCWWYLRPRRNLYLWPRRNLSFGRAESLSLRILSAD